MNNQNITKIIHFLKKAGVFYIATIDSDLPKIRPFSFVMEYDNKICFGTHSNKSVWKQIELNSNIEVCALIKNKWIRLSGKAIEYNDENVKPKAFQEMPLLKDIYANDMSNLKYFIYSIYKQ